MIGSKLAFDPRFCQTRGGVIMFAFRNPTCTAKVIRGTPANLSGLAPRQRPAKVSGVREIISYALSGATALILMGLP